MKKKRVYNSKARSASATETKERILASAKRLFQQKGFEAVTIDQLAEGARVSPSSIYSLFKSKKGLLRALMDEALPPEEFEAFVEQGKKEHVIEERLKISARMSRKIYDAERDLMDIFRGAAVIAPELKKLEKEREERRYRRQESFVRQLMEEKVLRKRMTLTEARDIVWVFTGRDLYRLMVIERGWTPDAYERWLAKQLINSLVD